jgi:septal ring factor EnvC (AmiA/AmiB activator)
MNGSLTHSMALLALFCLLPLTGCKDPQTERALADAKAELTQVRSQLQVAAQEVATLRDQLTKLTQDKDSALAKAADAQSMVETFKGQLQEQVQKIAGLQEQNSKLQRFIDELKKNLNEVKIPGIAVP